LFSVGSLGSIQHSFKPLAGLRGPYFEGGGKERDRGEKGEGKEERK